MAGIALVFAELAGCYLAWERELAGWEMTESQVVNRWISQGEAKGKLEVTQTFLIRALRRFGEPIPEEILATINTQTSLPLLED